MNRNGVDRAVVAAGVTVVLWASAFVVIRAAGEAFSPGAMAFLRLVSGVVVLTVILVVHRRRLARAGRRPGGLGGRATLLLLATYGAIWFGGYTVALNWSEQHVDAGTASLLVNFAPIIVAVIAGLFMGEGFNRALVVGIGVAFAGIVLITVGGSGAHADRLGIALGLVAAALYAAGVLMQKVALRRVDAVTATWVGMVAGLVVTAPFAPAAVDEVRSASAGDLVGVVFLGVGPTAIAFTTWAYALSRTDAGKLAATTLVVPALVVVMSLVFLGEIPTPLRIVGGVLCLLGVASSRGLLTRRRSAPAVTDHPTPATDVSPSVRT